MSEEEIKEHLFRKSAEAKSIARFLYDLILDVGNEKLSADNALHKIIEIVYRANVLSEDINGIAHQIKETKV